jgi:hypothetical protein
MARRRRNPFRVLGDGGPLRLRPRVAAQPWAVRRNRVAVRDPAYRGAACRNAPTEPLQGSVGRLTVETQGSCATLGYVTEPRCGTDSSGSERRAARFAPGRWLQHGSALRYKAGTAHGRVVCRSD